MDSNKIDQKDFILRQRRGGVPNPNLVVFKRRSVGATLPV